ncbi:MAG: alcohol dehydrogenase catalytic domain-containing protein [Deltaproteobacteria bacterium]|nr:alcohol dehydrogenase catalytic domain-containing protein [Deltaproteobacteria bacterium]
MLALYCGDDRQVTLKELPSPEPGPGEVLIRVTLAGVCGTDLQILRGYHDFQGVMGHEFVGVVAGPPDSPWLGIRVVGEINVNCGDCDLCRGGLPRHCRSRRVIGIKDRDGAFAPYLTLPEANLHAVPPQVKDEAAVFIEPLAAALAVTAAVRLPIDSPLLVVGDGRLGLLISWALALSAAEVHLVGHHADHLALAEPYGVTTFLEKDLPAGDYVAVVEASGAPQGLDLALSRVRPRGTVIVKSTFAGRYPLDPAALVVPEVRLAGSRCGPFAPALRLLAQARIDPRPLIAKRFPLSQGLEALAWAQRSGVLKVLLDCGEGS